MQKPIILNSQVSQTPSPTPSPAMTPLSFLETLFPPLRSSPNSRSPRTLKTLTLASSLQTERGLDFDTGDSFYRSESAAARDLAVLSVAIHRNKTLNTPDNPNPSVRILDAMCGCGVRSLRYLVQADADFVHANDAFEGNRPLILANLSRVSRVGDGGERRWIVTHKDANRVMVECYLNREYFDLVDVDSFGSDSAFIRSAVMVVRDGGLLYLTNTDGFSSGGHRPFHSLASYGAYVRPMPYSNEVGLRMLIGGTLREASALGFNVEPLFSYYSYHGPVFRVMLQVTRRKFGKNSNHYGFICYCHKCGNSQVISWGKLGQIGCSCNNEVAPQSLVVSGPLWTGPLHETSFVEEMLSLAGEWGWAHTKEKGIDLEKLLKQMIGESNPLLPFGYIKLDEIARRAKINSPPLRTIISSLLKEGYEVSRSHIDPNAIKTNCSMSTCLEIAREVRLVSTSNRTAQPAS